ncbi:MAG: hypothetical protein E6J38_09710 [Chloroflexi bacterium]|nr:MAG: hypothetical protein E6J38_09710 [Chloroflexota bacterium]
MTRATAGAGATSSATKIVFAASAPRTAVTATRSSVTTAVMRTNEFSSSAGRSTEERDATRVVAISAAPQ